MHCGSGQSEHTSEAAVVTLPLTPLAASLLKPLQPDGAERRVVKNTRQHEPTDSQKDLLLFWGFFFLAKLALTFPKTAEVPVRRLLSLKIYGADYSG